MRIDEIRVFDFRNIHQAELRFRGSRTVILGSNGQGKTNLLEAVHLLCVTRSFRSHRLQQILRAGQREFRVEGRFSSELRGPRRGRVSSGKEGLIFELDGMPVRRIADYFGSFPLALLSPERLEVSQGEPGNRRRFLDRLISFSSPVYLELLMRYRRALRQRGALLAGQAGNALPQKAPAIANEDGAQLEVWERELTVCGLGIMRRRRGFLEEFRPVFRKIHGEDFATDRFDRKIRDASEGTAESAAGEDDSGSPAESLEADIRYRSNLSEEDTEESLLRRYGEQREADRQRGYCTLGPHRDDLEFLLEGRLLRRFGSQGQHKLFILCLVLAETRVLREHSGEQPILLLDDLFGMLDDRRIERIGRAVDPEIQVLISTTSPRHLEVLGEGDFQVFHCEGGTYRESA